MPDGELKSLQDDIRELRRALNDHQRELQSQMLDFHRHAHDCTTALREQIHTSVEAMNQEWRSKIAEVRYEIGRLQIKTGLLGIIAGAVAGIGAGWMGWKK